MPWVTFGPTASATEGAPAPHQVLLLELPAELASPAFLRLFDADCGGGHDAPTGPFDTRTRFALYGGRAAASAPSLRTRQPTAEDLAAGTLLAELEVGDEPARNDRWTVLARLSPEQGEREGDVVRFKLVVQGVRGDDGNVFLAELSASEARSEPVPGARLLAYAPSLHLPDAQMLAELRARVPASPLALVLQAFDLGGATARLEGPWGTPLTLSSGEQGQWSEAHGRVEPGEETQALSLLLGGGSESPNDVALHLVANGQPVAFELPGRSVRLNRRPQPRVAVHSVSDCRSLAFDASASRDPDGDLLDFHWDFGDGSTGAGRRLTHAYAGPGRYTVRLRVEDSSGQLSGGAQERLEVVVPAPPEPEAGGDRVVAPHEVLTFDGSASRIPEGRRPGFHWDFGDGARAEGRQVRRAYANPGRYSATLRVDDGSGEPCSTAEARFQVRVNAPPSARVAPLPVAAVGEPLAFDASLSRDPDGAVAHYAWDFGDGQRGEGARASHAYPKPGRYSATLTVRDDSGASNASTTERFTVWVNHPPRAVLRGSRGRVAVGEVLRFEGSLSRDEDGRLMAWRWDFGNGQGAEGPVVTYAYAQPGNYTVTLAVEDDAGARSEERFTLAVNAPPVARASAPRVVTSSEVRFDGSGSSDPDGAITAWEWDFGDGGRGLGVAPLHVYARPGPWRVRLTVRDDSGTASGQAEDEILVVVNARPIADAGPDRMASPGEGLEFSGRASVDADGEIVTYRWDFGDGTEAEGRAVTHAFSAPGVYRVRLTVRDDSGHEEAVDVDEARVTVNAPPVARAGLEVLTAPGLSVRLDGSGSYDPDGTSLSYRWTFSDGASEVVGPTATRSFARPGVYEATLAARDGSGARNGLARDVVRIHVNAPPRAQPGRDRFTCDRTVTLDGTASSDPDGQPLAYTWDFGDGSPKASGPRVSHTFAQGGSYPVVLRVDDGTGLPNASHAASLTVTLGRPPVAEAGEDRTVCAGQVVVFNAGRSRDPDEGLLKFLWDFGDGTTGRGQSPTKVYRQGGLYTVSLSAEDDSGLEACSRDVDRLTLRVAEAPVAEAGEDQTVCAGREVRFDGSRSRDADGVVNGFAWDFGDGERGGGVTPTHVYSKAGTHRVRLTITGDRVGQCDDTDTDELVVSVHEAPAARLSAPQAVAVGEEVALDASGSTSNGAPITSWQWDFGDSTAAEGERVTHRYEKPGRYVVAMTARTDLKTDCGASTARGVLTVNAPPVADAGADIIVAEGEEVAFDGAGSRDPDGALTAWRWDFGDGATGSEARVRHTYAKAGRYTATLSVTDDSGVGSGTASDTRIVVVNAAPRPVLAAPARACARAPVALGAGDSTDADGSITAWRWDFGDGARAEGVNVTHAYAAPGAYQVTLTVEDSLGASNSRRSASHRLVVNQPPLALAGPDLRACPGQGLTFDGGRSLDPEGSALRLRWEFGDGAQAEGRRVTHAWAQPGTYAVRLVADDGSGTSCSEGADEAQVVVNAPPVAVAGDDREALVGGAHDVLTFDAGGSSDPDGGRLSYEWDFGDGHRESGARVLHAFQAPGRYRVRLRVRDDSGTVCAESLDELVVNARRRAPETAAATSREGK
ncbi:MAG: PKD domain-containing protein [Myxococcaceae bacterium]|nr:PKD domain-containing protein [Myxococcaceae bacterium]